MSKITSYITVPPSRKEWAEGYVAALGNYEEDIQYEIFVSKDCPLDKVYISTEPLNQTGG